MPLQRTAEETLRLFCQSWFEQRDAEGTLALLSPDLTFVGAIGTGPALNLAQTADYIRKSIQEAPEPCACTLSIVDEQPITPCVCNLFTELTLQSPYAVRRLQGCATLERQPDRPWLIRSLHVADRRATLLSTCIDITARKRAQDEVQLLYNNIPGAVFRCRFDDDFTVIDANDGLFDFLGYTRAEFAALGSRMSAVIHPEDLSNLREKLLAQLEHGHTIHHENRLVCKDGSVKWISIKAQLLQGSEPYFYCIFVDITDEKRLRVRIRELYEQELAYFSELTSEDGSIQGRFNVTRNRLESSLTTSDIALAKDGDSYDQAIAAFASSAADPQCRDAILRGLARENVLTDYAAGKVNYRFDFLRRRSDGREFWGSTSFRSCRNPETGDVMLFFRTTDITEKKLQEELLNQLAVLNYDVIMEISIPLDTHRIISFDRRQRETIPRQGKFQEGIRDIADRFMDAAAKKEYLSKLDYAYMERQLAQRPAYSFVLEVQDRWGDRRVKRFQVFSISKELGRVCLARSDVTDVVRQEQRQKEELASALYGGTGLGLAISKSIVDMMGGKITVRSIKGIGTEFTVDVKLGVTEEDRLRHRPKKQDYNFSHLKTLVVDDDVAVCESAILTLREMGIQAEWVDSGRKAVDQVRVLWDRGRYYDLILIDWKMPEMDGLETARRIRAIVGPEVTIIIMTAYDWTAIEHEAKLAGVNLLMSKPMFKSSLISAFSKALGEKEEHTQPVQEPDYDFTGRRVLLAEDNAISTEVAVLLLESKGFQVDTAENGLRALEMFSKTEQGYYSAILMDIRMPLMDGLTAAANIRHLSNADARTIPIIAMTANAFDDDIEKSRASGMNAHLAKPVDPALLYQTLYDFIFREGE